MGYSGILANSAVQKGIGSKSVARIIRRNKELESLAILTILNRVLIKIWQEPDRFDVNIHVPLTLIPYVTSAKSLTYRCETAQLPGRTFATTEQRTYGPIEKFPVFKHI
jgi:non-ribosomal peptide synthetase component E (peptide arylation enzyme)